MVEITPTGNTLDEQVLDISQQIANFISNAHYTTEESGIGYYEYAGATGYDSQKSVLYDDEEYFKIDISNLNIPRDYEGIDELWSDMEAFAVITTEDEELVLNPEIINGEYFFVIKRT